MILNISDSYIPDFFFFFIYSFIYSFIYGCVGSSFLCEGPLQLWQVGATLHHGARASHCSGPSRCGAQAPDAQAQQLWLTGVVAPRHVGSSQTRARTRVPCIGRQILNHCATREALYSWFLKWRSFGIGRCKLLHMEWIDNKDCIAQDIQYSVINHNGNEKERKRKSLNPLCGVYARIYWLTIVMQFNKY